MDLRSKYKDLRKVLVSVYSRMAFGCGNHGCLVMSPRGQGANGPCMCRPRRLTQELLNVAAEIERIDESKLD